VEIGLAATSSGTSCAFADAIGCRGPRSTCGSARISSTSSGERRFVVETDSYPYHRGRAAFQDDHGRDLELIRLGYEVLRLSERQLEAEAKRAAEVLAAKLGGSRSR
jgi:hypothetical protein